jgi:hypothetical protein
LRHLSLPEFCGASPCAVFGRAFSPSFAVRSARVQAQHGIFASLIIVRAGGDRRAQGTVGLGADAQSRAA